MAGVKCKFIDPDGKKPHAVIGRYCNLKLPVYTEYTWREVLFKCSEKISRHNSENLYNPYYRSRMHGFKRISEEVTRAHTRDFEPVLKDWETGIVCRQGWLLPQNFPIVNVSCAYVDILCLKSAVPIDLISVMQRILPMEGSKTTAKCSSNSIKGKILENLL